MSISYPVVNVTFELPSSVDATSVAVVGDFNGWSCDASPMTRTVAGSFRLSMSLTAGRVYQYRYLIDGSRWVNDWKADSYVPNAFGGDDSVVDLTAGGTRFASHLERLESPPSLRADSLEAEETPRRQRRPINPSQPSRKVHENACSEAPQKIGHECPQPAPI